MNIDVANNHHISAIDQLFSDDNFTVLDISLSEKHSTVSGIYYDDKSCILHIEAEDGLDKEVTELSFAGVNPENFIILTDNNKHNIYVTLMRKSILSDSRKTLFEG